LRDTIDQDFAVNDEVEPRLMQTGKEVSGTFGEGGQIWGEVNDNTIRFDFFGPRGIDGRGEWAFERSKISGKWESSFTGDGDWNLTRLE